MSLRDVHRMSAKVGKKLASRSFVISPSRLHFYETHPATPSIYRLYTLACIYGRKLSDVLAWYGIPYR
jgi:cyanate lyase